MLDLLSDEYLFPLIQLSLALFCVYILVLDEFRSFRKKREPVVGTVTRGSNSLAVFYGAYGVLTATFLGLSLTVDYADNHRTFWVASDIALIAYACMWNAWFRGKLIYFTIEVLPKREH